MNLLTAIVILPLVAFWPFILAGLIINGVCFVLLRRSRLRGARAAAIQIAAIAIPCLFIGIFAVAENLGPTGVMEAEPWFGFLCLLAFNGILFRILDAQTSR